MSTQPSESTLRAWSFIVINGKRDFEEGLMLSCADFLFDSKQLSALKVEEVVALLFNVLSRLAMVEEDAVAGWLARLNRVSDRLRSIAVYNEHNRSPLHFYVDQVAKRVLDRGFSDLDRSVISVLVSRERAELYRSFTLACLESDQVCLLGKENTSPKDSFGLLISGSEKVEEAFFGLNPLIHYIGQSCHDVFLEEAPERRGFIFLGDSSGRTALHHAVLLVGTHPIGEKISLLEKLHELGAHHNVKDRKGDTPYSLAFKARNKELILWFHDKYGVQYQAIFQVLETACKWRNVDLVGFLLLIGLPVDCRDGKGETPADTFLKIIQKKPGEKLTKEEQDIFDLLRAPVTGLEKKLEKDRESSLFEAVISEDVESVSNLLSEKCRVDFFHLELQMTPLMLAALYGSEELVKTLVEIGRADPDLIRPDGISALHFAALSGNHSLFLYLLKKTRAGHHTQYGTTPIALYDACMHASKRVRDGSEDCKTRSPLAAPIITGNLALFMRQFADSPGRLHSVSSEGRLSDLPGKAPIMHWVLSTMQCKTTSEAMSELSRRQGEEKVNRERVKKWMGSMVRGDRSYLKELDAFSDPASMINLMVDGTTLMHRSVSDSVAHATALIERGGDLFAANREGKKASELTKNESDKRRLITARGARLAAEILLLKERKIDPPRYLMQIYFEDEKWGELFGKGNWKGLQKGLEAFADSPVEAQDLKIDRADFDLSEVQESELFDVAVLALLANSKELLQAVHTKASLSKLVMKEETLATYFWKIYAAEYLRVRTFLIPSILSAHTASNFPDEEFLSLIAEIFPEYQKEFLACCPFPVDDGLLLPRLAGFKYYRKIHFERMTLLEEVDFQTTVYPNRKGQSAASVVCLAGEPSLSLDYAFFSNPVLEEILNVSWEQRLDDLLEKIMVNPGLATLGAPILEVAKQWANLGREPSNFADTWKPFLDALIASGADPLAEKEKSSAFLVASCQNGRELESLRSYFESVISWPAREVSKKAVRKILNSERDQIEDDIEALKLNNAVNLLDPETQMTPLIAAVLKNDLHAIRLLVRAGAKPDIQSRADGITPLHIAALYDSSELYFFLCRYASSDPVTEYGMSSLEILSKRSLEEQRNFHSLVEGGSTSLLFEAVKMGRAAELLFLSVCLSESIQSRFERCGLLDVAKDPMTILLINLLGIGIPTESKEQPLQGLGSEILGIIAKSGSRADLEKAIMDSNMDPPLFRALVNDLFSRTDFPFSKLCTDSNYDLLEILLKCGGDPRIFVHKGFFWTTCSDQVKQLLCYYAGISELENRSSG